MIRCDYIPPFSDIRHNENSERFEIYCYVGNFNINESGKVKPKGHLQMSFPCKRFSGISKTQYGNSYFP